MDPKPEDMAPALVAIGKIVGARGLRGEVKIKAFTKKAEDVAAYGPLQDAEGTRSFDLRICGRAKELVIVRIAGVNDRDQAESLRGATLYLRREALPKTDEDEYYYADLVGLRAELTDGTAIGQVLAVHDFGAGEIIEVERPDKQSLMVSFSRAFVPEVDLAGRRIVIAALADLDAAPEESDDGA